MERIPSCAGTLLLALLLGCFSEHTAPSSGGSGVTVGNDFFQSNRNGSSGPAVDTVSVGDSLTWTWVNTGASQHSVASDGPPDFTSSAILTGDGSSYTVTFGAPGSYEYDCAVHLSAMTGRVVVR